MLKRNILILLIISANYLNASIPNKPVGGQAVAMGQVWISQNDSWSSTQNNAALGWQKQYWLGVHHENRFLIKELGISTIGAQIPVTPGTFGLNISHFGYSQFNITRAELAYGMKLSVKFSAGIGFNYHMMQIAGDYQNKQAFTVEGGIQYTPTKKLIIGVFIFNPTHASLNEQQSLSPMMGIGLSYLPNEKLTLAVQLDDDTENKPTIRGGLEYKAIDNFAFRIGYSSGNPEGLTGGFGWTVKEIQIDLSFGYHPILGYTPQLSVSYRFGKIKAE